MPLGSEGCLGRGGSKLRGWSDGRRAEVQMCHRWFWVLNRFYFYPGAITDTSRLLCAYFTAAGACEELPEEHSYFHFSFFRYEGLVWLCVCDVPRVEDRLGITVLNNDYTGLFMEWSLNLYVCIQAVTVHRFVMGS